MIVATAGHVDHGKTALVRALTGVDTDRSAEEKRRGMTIDLGFAHADVGGAAPVAFIDVPGHERFVRNMLAGVACIDLALLVIAADDGPMPQTREHVAILGLLGVAGCVVALTKIDRVADERLSQLEREIEALLAAGPYRGAPVFRVDAIRGAGVTTLRRHLGDASRTLAARPAVGNFRLAVDRSFLLAGAGRIVTGAVLAGSVRVGDAVVVSPRGIAARVRGIHAGNSSAASARAGERCALNLAGAELKHAEPVRGDWIVAAAAHAPTTRLDVRLDLIDDADNALAHPGAGRGGALQLHIGAAAVGTRCVGLDPRNAAPGAALLAQLVLDAPIAALHADRFILRGASARRTIAGGIVIDPFAPARGRAAPARIAQLRALQQAAPAAALAGLLDARPEGVELRRFALARNLTDAETAELCRASVFRTVAGPDGPLALSTGHWQALRDLVCGTLAAWHAEQPDSIGPTLAALAGRLGRRVAGAALRDLLGALLDDGTLVRDRLRLRLATHRAVLSEADAALLGRVTGLLRPAGLRPPIVGTLAAALDLPQPPLLDFLQRASRLGQLAGVAPNRFFLPETIDELVAIARRLAGAAADGCFDAAAYRDASGIGRNLTVQVLEFLDREGLTRFDGERRRSVV